MVAKRLDRRLSVLGSEEVLPRGLGDDQHPLGYEGALDSWLQALWTRLSPLISLDLVVTQVGSCFLSPLNRLSNSCTPACYVASGFVVRSKTSEEARALCSDL